MRFFRNALVLCLATSMCGCITEYPNPATPYVQRIDTVTLAAGDAQNVNTATHTIDPWPPYAGNRRIPGDGARMAGAVERYEGIGRGAPAGGPNSPGSGAPIAPPGAPPLYPLAPITPPANQ